MGSSIISLGLGLGGGKSATSSGRPGGGAFSNSLSCLVDGSDDYTTADNSAVDLSGNLTISWWMKTVTTGSQEAFMSSSGYGVVGTTGWALFEKSGNFNLWTSVGASYTQTMSQFAHGVSVGSWCQVVLTRTGSTLKCYVDTVEKKSVTSSADLSIDSGQTFRLGRGGSYYWNGNIDECAIWPSALSSDDRTTVYSSGVPDDLASLSPVNWWRMGDNNGGTGTTVTDQGSGADDMTLINEAAFEADVPT